MQNNRAQTIVWDWNGTLIEDLAANIVAVNAVMAHFGKPAITTSIYQREFEVPISNMYCRLGFTNTEFEANAALIQDLFHDTYEIGVANVGFRPHARAFIEASRRRGDRHVILSNHIASSIHDHLARMKAADLFDAVLAHPDRQTQKLWKPKGERLSDYLTANGIDARACLIVGDTPEEVEIARQLGLTSVAIADGFATDDRLRAAQPDHFIRSYDELQPLLQCEVA